MTWLKDKWKWAATGLAVLVTLLVAFLAGRGVSKDEIQAALALRGVREATRKADEADKKAADLKAESDKKLAEYTAEQVRLEAAREKANALPATDKLIELRKRGIIK